ncbi:MAG: hypothetical protein L0215_13770 [Gemmataceae bacterium]|nr:hypothetical protein [Gemmataceae bacterium]
MSLSDQPLAEAVRRPYFRVERCNLLRRDGEELVEVVFGSPHDVDQNTSDLVQGGSLLLDPKRFWCVRSYELQGKSWLGAGTLTFQLGKANENVAILPLAQTHNRIDNWTFNKPINDRSTNKQEWHYDLSQMSEPARIPGDEEFTLSAFGIQEPRGLGSRPTPWYLWAGLAGGLCLILSVVFRWRKARLARTGA